MPDLDHAILHLVVRSLRGQVERAAGGAEVHERRRIGAVVRAVVLDDESGLVVARVVVCPRGGRDEDKRKDEEKESFHGWGRG